VDADNSSLQLDTHYPCLRAVFTGRVHDLWTRVSKMTPVFTGHAHGPWTRVRSVYRDLQSM